MSKSVKLSDTQKKIVEILSNQFNSVFVAAYSQNILVKHYPENENGAHRERHDTVLKSTMDSLEKNGIVVFVKGIIHNAYELTDTGRELANKLGYIAPAVAEPVEPDDKPLATINRHLGDLGQRQATIRDMMIAAGLYAKYNTAANREIIRNMESDERAIGWAQLYIAEHTTPKYQPKVGDKLTYAFNDGSMTIVSIEGTEATVVYEDGTGEEVSLWYIKRTVKEGGYIPPVPQVEQPAQPEAELYEYALFNRPAVEAAPKGWQIGSPASERFDYGTITYTRKLTDKEVYDYELYPVSPNAFAFQVGDRVLVNDCDTATIMRQEMRNRYTVRFDATGTTENVHSKNVARLNDEPEAAPVDAETASEATFNVGDIVAYDHDSSGETQFYTLVERIGIINEYVRFAVDRWIRGEWVAASSRFVYDMRYATIDEKLSIYRAIAAKQDAIAAAALKAVDAANIEIGKLTNQKWFEDRRTRYPEFADKYATWEQYIADGKRVPMVG